MKKLLLAILTIAASAWLFIEFRTPDQPAQYGHVTVLAPPDPSADLDSANITSLLLSIKVSPAPDVPLSPQDRQDLLTIFLSINSIVELPDEPDIHVPRKADVWTIFEANFPESNLSSCMETVNGVQMVSLKKFGKCAHKEYRRLFEK